MTWQVTGLGQKVHREQLATGLPDDLAAEFQSLSQWAHGLPERYGSRVTIRLVDAASIEGFFKSLVRGLNRYPAFIVEGRKYVGNEFVKVDALISEILGAHQAGS